MKRRQFKDVQAGDWIYTIQSKWERVENILAGNEFLVVTKSSTYRNDGRRYIIDKMPSAWTYDPFDGTEPPVDLPGLEVDAKVLVRDSEEEVWVARHFEAWANEGGMLCYREGKTSWSGAFGFNRKWNYWQLPKDGKEVQTKIYCNHWGDDDETNCFREWGSELD